MIRKIFGSGWATLWPGQTVIRKPQRVEPIEKISDKQDFLEEEQVQTYSKDGKITYVRKPSRVRRSS